MSPTRSEPYFSIFDYILLAPVIVLTTVYEKCERLFRRFRPYRATLKDLLRLEEMARIEHLLKEKGFTW